MFYKAFFVTMGFVAAAVIFGVSSTSANSELLPNLSPYPASSIRLEIVGANTLLRFSTTGWNDGAGALELRAGEVDRDNGRQNVYQRVFTSNGNFADYLAGAFAWHELHSHFHFEDYANYTLQPVNAPGGSERVGHKTTFCVMDTTRVNTKLPGAPKQAHYNTCGSQIQGMSVGWGDTYGYYLAGQEIDITDLPNGDYRLKIELDPKGKIFEINEADNISTIDIRLADGTVSVIGNKPGRNR